MDPEKERCPGAVGDPRPRDVADARALGRRPRHHDPQAGALEQAAKPECDPQVQVGLAESADHAMRPPAVLDLPRRRAGTDRLGRGIRPEVVAGVDHDRRALLRARRGDDEQHRDDDEGRAH